MTDVGWADSGFSVLCRTRCLIRDPAPVPGKESTPCIRLMDSWLRGVNLARPANVEATTRSTTPTT
jgi:hypothetical protein